MRNQLDAAERQLLDEFAREHDIAPSEAIHTTLWQTRLFAFRLGRLWGLILGHITAWRRQ